jgi:hypothetical protein
VILNWREEGENSTGPKMQYNICLFLLADTAHVMLRHARKCNKINIELLASLAENDCMMMNCPLRTMSSPKPTYGELIHMLEAAEGQSKISGESVSELLASYFHRQYPFIPIGRPSRFHDTVQRIAAPTQRNTMGKQLGGSPLRSYLQRVWMPRIRNTQQGDNEVKINYLDWVCLLPTGSTPSFPSELQKHGVTETILTKALLQCSQAKILPVDVDWTLKETPTVGFYRELHIFLKKWPVSRALTKVALGRFYVSIDPQLYSKGMCGRPDNVYLFIERVVSSDRDLSAPMSYGHIATVERLRKERCVYSNEVEELSTKVQGTAGRND